MGSLHVYPCRVWAADEAEALRKVEVLLAGAGLTPVMPLRLRQLTVEQEGQIWCECHALCEG